MEKWDLFEQWRGGLPSGMCIKDVTALYVPQGRDKMSVREAIAGAQALRQSTTD